jgi:hypothetical protein
LPHIPQAGSERESERFVTLAEGGQDIFPLSGRYEAQL